VSSWNLDFFQEHSFADKFSLVIKTGGFVELFYQLKGFGIPTNALPLDMMGNFHYENHEKWYQNRQAIETALHEAAILAAKEEQRTRSDGTNKDDRISIIPRPIDVLMGKEKLSVAHAGNIKYQILIARFQERYDACETKIEKTVIASALAMQVKANGGRFLLRKKGETTWSEAAESVVSEKVTNAFRGRRKTAIKRIKRSYDGTSDTASKRRLPDLYQPLPARSDDFGYVMPKRIAGYGYDAF
jgi:hypothetical protein